MKKRSLDYEIIDPDAAATIHSLRAFGYDVTAAVADLIDNSISAEATKIDVHFHWAGKDSYAYILDNGNGMSELTLSTKAMRIGSFHPDAVRKTSDLGRFGLGLKTASFSQCKLLTVSSTCSGSCAPAQRNWDLDYVNKHREWRLLKGPGAVARQVLSDLGKKHPSPGTVVIWESMDRLVGGEDARDEKAKLRFHRTLDRIGEHLSMVFHQFLSGKTAVRINFNGNPLIPWDPYLLGVPATQDLNDHHVFLRDHKITATPYILPHRSMITDEQYESAEGPRGWVDMQGFYVYRNRRLLVAGSWLGLKFWKEEHYKLARIKIELPNNLDHDWQLDVKKCTAVPHPSIQPALMGIAMRARADAMKIYRARGKALATNSSPRHIPLWQHVLRRGKLFYRINRTHPVVKSTLQVPDKTNIALLLRLLEETMPAASVRQMQADKPESIPLPFETAKSSDFVRVLELVYKSFRKAGKNHQDSIEQLAFTEPFDAYPERIAALDERLRR